MKKGFTLIEVLISVGLLALIAVVSSTMVVNLVRSSAKLQANIDIDHASNFILLKVENDVKKSYSAAVDATGRVLTLQQNTGVVTYSLKQTCNGVLNCLTVNTGAGEVKLTDDTLDSVTGKATTSAVDLDLANSGFAVIQDASAVPRAVSIKITFFKPLTAGTKLFESKATLDTSIVLRGSY